MIRYILLWSLLSASTLCAQAEPWKFIAVGDSRGTNNGINEIILNEIAAEIVTQQVEFVLFAGDMVNGSGIYATLKSQLTSWRTAMQPVYSAGIAVYPIRGNHDAGNLQAWHDVFSGDYALPGNGPPGESNLTYSAVHNNALLVGLDGYADNRKINVEWLASLLATNDKPHIFTYSHEPAFKVRNFICLDDRQSTRDAFWSCLAAAGARAYFCGHDHFYDHARIDDGDGNGSNDLHQFVVATAGAPLYGEQPYDGANSGMTPTKIYFERQYGYVVGTVNSNEVSLVWWHRTGPESYEATAEQFCYTARDGRQKQTASFRQGDGAYSSTVDTKLFSQTPDTAYPTSTSLEVASTNTQQVLLRFNDIFGSNAGQIPIGNRTIHWAGLQLNTTTAGDGASLHRMLKDWADTDTWNAWTNGIQTNGIEAASIADVITYPEGTGVSVIDVTSSLQSWIQQADPNAANKGWAFLPSGTNAWGFSSSEESSPPMLTVLFSDNLAVHGTPLWWLEDYGLTNGGWTFDQAETNNPDADAHTSAEEYIADTSPIDSNSCFRMIGITFTNGPVLSFNSSTARVYDLESSTNLVTGHWIPVRGQTNVPGDASGTTSLVDTNPAGFRAYRARVKLP